MVHKGINSKIGTFELSACEMIIFQSCLHDAYQSDYLLDFKEQSVKFREIF